MEQIEVLKSKGVLVKEMKGKKEELQKQWEDAFAKNLSKSQKNKINFYQHFWHVFSFNKLSCLEGQKARDAFNKVKKDGCYIFYQDEENSLMLENARSLKVEDIVKEFEGYIDDVYVGDTNFKWTYVCTHEEYCGPYFYHLEGE